MQNIHTVLKDLESDYRGGTIELAEGLEFSQYNTLREIQFMSSSRYISGGKDRYGREKPYFNIVNANVMVAVVATDVDRKDLDFTSDNPDDEERSFVMRRLADNWMRDIHFGAFQNRAGETRARYGGVLVKKVEEDGKLDVQVVQWGNIDAVDPSSIVDGVIVETHYLDAAELTERTDVYGTDNVREAIKLFTDKKGKCSKITIKEIHGVLPDYLMSDEELVEDAYTYSRQHHILAVKGSKFVELYKELEEENPYKYRAWEYKEKRDLGEGVVEKGLWSQIMTNDAIIGEREAFDLGRKVLFKTNSRKVGNNALTDLDNGDIISLDDGKDINILSTISNNIPEFQNLVEKWQAQFDRATAITDALRGEVPPAGQSYHLGALVTQQAASTFDYLREDMGFFYEEIFRDWVLPYLIKKYTKQQIIASDLFSTDELMQLDEKYAIYHANKSFKEKMLAGENVTPELYEALLVLYRNHIATSGKKRYLDIPDTYFKGYAGRAVFNITGEEKNKQAILESLSSIFQSVQANPVVLQDPILRKIFGRILELSGTGLTALDLEQVGQQAPQQTPQVQPQAQAAQPVSAQRSSLNLPGPAAVTNNG